MLKLIPFSSSPSPLILYFIYLYLFSFLSGFGSGCGYGVYAQSFAIPANWRKPTSSLSRADRAGLVNGVLDTILPTFNSSSGLLDGLTITQTASLLIALSNNDWISGSTKNKDAVLVSLDTVFAQNPDISTVVNSDPAIWGLAAISAYRAYADPSALQHAQSMWDLLEEYMITEEDAANGTHPLKEAQFQSSCNGASTAGGVFYLASSPQNTDVNGETVGAFMALSAHLHAETSNTTYLAAANLSASFILNQLFNGAVVLDTITLVNCFTTQDVVTYNSGFVIEGLSLLASVKGIGDLVPGNSRVTYQEFLDSLISTAVTNQKWTNVTDGVITEGPGNATLAERNDFGQALKGILIRGLYEAYNHTSPGTVVADFISSFITVQLNTLQDRACGGPGGNHSYSSRWEGPPPTQMLPWGQLAALDVLNSAVGIAPPDSASSNPTIPSSNPSTAAHTSLTGAAVSSAPSPTWTVQADSDTSQRSHSPTKAAIIAGTLAGVFALLVIAILGVLFVIRRNKKRLDHIRQILETTAVPYNPTARGSLSSETSSGGNMVEVRVEQSSTERLIPGHMHNGLSTSTLALAGVPPITRRREGDYEAKTTRLTRMIVPIGSYAKQERRSPTAQVLPSEDPSLTSSSPGGDTGIKEASQMIGIAVQFPSAGMNESSVVSTDRDPELESPSVPGQPPSTADLPELLSRLNQIMLHLPPGGVEEEDPPEYEG